VQYDVKTFRYELSSIDFVPVSEHNKEVIMVIVSPNDEILLLEKSFYPGALRLPSGGMKKHESAQEAARRELGEETGIKINRNRFSMLCVIEYTFRGEIMFTSYAMACRLLETPSITLDTEYERIVRFVWCDIGYLSKVIEYLENFIPENLQTWGVFRAMQHQAILETISAQPI
jgi:8-oxo-dGTP pyrophosphatase MutT (NUDIX family)